MQDDYLNTRLKEREKQLTEARKTGTKIVGYFPGSYVPEELIAASGAIPVCLIHGGDTKPVEAAATMLPAMFCPFARAQVGQKILNNNPFYNMIDMLVAPITCQHLKKVAEIWEYLGYTDIYKLGIPHQYKNSYEVDYYAERLTIMKDKLESLTENEITDEGIRNAISQYNRIRELLRQISLIRRSTSPSISSLDFIKLNHASYLLDSAEMIKILEDKLKHITSEHSDSDNEKPRILLMGPNISLGDYSIYEMVEKAGGNIVAEEFFEGTRNYQKNIDDSGDPISALAKGYLVDRVPPAFMRYSTGPRLDYILQLISDFNISGIIWYELLCCETYDAESYFFSRKMSERNIPVLTLESDYGTVNQGQIKTRIEAFMEMLTGGL